MSYDSAQLARVLLHAWQVTGNEFFRTVTEEIPDYVMREMTDPAGGFYSTQGADSEGEAGKFLSGHRMRFDRFWARMPTSSWPPTASAGTATSKRKSPAVGGGKNVLEFVGDIMDQRPVLAEARRVLFEGREKRVHPGCDEKVLTSWNGLMLAAFAESPQALDRDDGSRGLAASYRQVAERSADFLLRELRLGNGRLLRTWKAGKARLSGYLKDYAYLIEGLLELYQITLIRPF